MAAPTIARLLARYPGIAWIGLVIVLYVAIDMIWRGSYEVVCTWVPETVCQAGMVRAVGSLAGW